MFVCWWSACGRVGMGHWDGEKLVGRKLSSRRGTTECRHADADGLVDLGTVRGLDGRRSRGAMTSGWK